MDNKEAIHSSNIDTTELKLGSNSLSSIQTDFVLTIEEEMQNLHNKIVDLEKKNFQLLSKKPVEMNPSSELEIENRQLKERLRLCEAQIVQIQQSFESEKNKIEHEAFQYIGANSQLEMILVKSKAKYEEAQGKIERAVLELGQASAQNQLLENELNNWKNTVTKLENEIVGLKKESQSLLESDRRLASQEQTLEQTKNEVNRLTIQLNSLAEQKNQAMQLVAETRNKFIAVQNEAANRESKIRNLESNILELTEEMNHLRAEIKRMHTANSLLKAERESLDSEISCLKLKSKSDIESAVTAANQRWADKVSQTETSAGVSIQKMHMSESRAKLLEEKNEKLIQENRMAAEMFRRLDEKSQSQSQEGIASIRKLESRIQELEFNLRSKDNEAITNQKKLEDKFNEHLSALVQNHQFELKQLSENHLQQTNELFNMMSTRQVELNELQKKLEDNTQISNQAMRQTSQYVSFVEIEKNKIRRELNNLTIEIKRATSLHPLKDLLEATDSELNRYEMELKKTPASASTRPNLESRLEQLCKQKIQLQSLIKNTESHLASFAQEIAKIESQSGVLDVPCPVKLLRP